VPKWIFTRRGQRGLTNVIVVQQLLDENASVEYFGRVYRLAMLTFKSARHALRGATLELESRPSRLTMVRWAAS
jgi:hypothetical protein